MQSSKTVLLLKTFSKDELKQFGNFLKSPYFNTNTRVVKLFDELKKYHPDYTGKGASKENLYKRIFPGKAYNEQIIKNLISELLRLGKEFLSVNNYIGDPYEKSIGLISQLSSRDVSQMFAKEAQAFEEIARNSKTVLGKLYYYLFSLEEEKFRNSIYTNKQSSVSENLVKSGEYLSIFFLKNILRLAINTHINRFSFNKHIEINFSDKLLNLLDLDEIVSYMENMNIEDSISIKLLCFALKSNTNINDDKSYNLYRTLLKENIDRYKEYEAHMYLQFLESACAQKINAGRLEFYKDIFETYEMELEKKLYTPTENLPLTTMKFRNIYLSAVRVGKFEWAEKFIHKYKSELVKENRQNIVELALAQINFEKREFDKTLEHLRKVKTEEIFFKIDVRILNLMSLYELGHYQSTLSLIDSFRRMLNSNISLTEQYSEKNINFVNSLNWIIKVKMDNDDKGVDKLIEKINNFESLANKKWLLKKVEEMKH